MIRIDEPWDCHISTSGSDNCVTQPQNTVSSMIMVISVLLNGLESGTHMDLQPVDRNARLHDSAISPSAHKHTLNDKEK